MVGRRLRLRVVAGKHPDLNLESINATFECIWKVGGPKFEAMWDQLIREGPPFHEATDKAWLHFASIL